jgi:hypothetical protein
MRDARLQPGSISFKHALQVTYERRSFVHIVLKGSAPQSAAAYGCSRSQMGGWALLQ